MKAKQNKKAAVAKSRDYPSEVPQWKLEFSGGLSSSFWANRHDAERRLWWAKRGTDQTVTLVKVREGHIGYN